MSQVTQESRTQYDALADFSLTLATLQSAIAQLGEQAGEDPVPHRSGDELESAWLSFRRR